MNAAVLEASVSFREHPFLRPLVLSSGAITRVTEAGARVRVRVGGREAEGRGSVLLSHVWSGGDEAGMRRTCEGIARGLSSLCGGEPAHPWELGLRLHGTCRSLSEVVCASPFDAAIHDAAGRALGRSAFSFYGEDIPIPSAEPFLSGGACRAVRETLRAPRRTLEGWWVVGGDLEEGRGFRNFKVKTNGKDPSADAARVAEVFDAARRRGIPSPRLSVDPNEGCPDAAGVLEFLKALRKDVFESLLYVEQPTPRGSTFDWHEVARLKPVILDEGMVRPGSLAEAGEQGWSGFALKTAKGHGFNLLAAAWARRHGLVLTLQDLSNVGWAGIHAALLGSRVETLNDLELNSPQFLPAANAEWLPRLSGLFEPEGGVHEVPDPDAPGLGSGL